MTSNVPNNFNVNQKNNFLNAGQASSYYIPAMYTDGRDSYESKSKKTCRTIKTVTSILNSVLLTAGISVAGFFGFKWLKGSNLSFMSNPLEKVKFSNNLPSSKEIHGNNDPKNKLNEIITKCKNEKKGCGVLLQGPPRCGKTLSANVYAKESGLTTFSCKTSSIISTVKGQTEKNIDKMFEQLRQQVKKDGKPVILIMDEIDSFLMSRDNATNEERAMVNAFLRNCDNLEEQGIIILGSTNYGNKCDTAAIGSGRFNQKISFNLPETNEIEQMLYGKSIDNSPTEPNEKAIKEIAQFMHDHNMNWADAQNIKKEFFSGKDNKTIKRKEALLYLIDKCKGQSPIQISTLKADNHSGASGSVAWDNIYGVDTLKKDLIDWVDNVGNEQNAQDAKSGFLLAGPPGCGKSTLPYALAKQKETAVYTLRLNQNGVTVNNIKDIIEELKLEGKRRQVNQEPPLILFLDEAESMFPNRKSADEMANTKDASDRTATTLDALQNLQNYGICLIAATNHPEMIDEGLKREGRLSEYDIKMPQQSDIQDFIKKEFPALATYAEKIAECFMDNSKSCSRLSFANITGVLRDWTQKLTKKNDPSVDDLENLTTKVKAKEDQMNAKPLESGLTQIGQALNKIEEQLKSLDSLKSLENLEDMKTSLANLRAAFGEVGEDKDPNKKTMLNLLEILTAKISTLENLKNITQLCEDIKTLASNNSEVVESFNKISESLKTTMNSILQITETDKNITHQLMDHNQAWAKLLEELKNAFNIQNATQGDLATAIAQLRAALHTIQPSSRGGGMSENIGGAINSMSAALNHLVMAIERRLPDIRKDPLHNQILQDILYSDYQNQPFFQEQLFSDFFTLKHSDDKFPVYISPGMLLAWEIVRCSNSPNSSQSKFPYDGGETKINNMKHCTRNLNTEITAQNNEDITTLNNMLDKWNQNCTADKSKQINLQSLLKYITYKDALCDPNILEENLKDNKVDSLNNFVKEYNKKNNNNNDDEPNKNNYILTNCKDTLNLAEVMKLINKICHKIYDITFDALYKGEIPGENVEIC